MIKNFVCKPVNIAYYGANLEQLSLMKLSNFKDENKFIIIHYLQNLIHLIDSYIGQINSVDRKNNKLILSKDCITELKNKIEDINFNFARKVGNFVERYNEKNKITFIRTEEFDIFQKNISFQILNLITHITLRIIILFSKIKNEEKYDSDKVLVIQQYGTYFFDMMVIYIYIYIFIY
jgi:hypothetical protein